MNKRVLAVIMGVAAVALIALNVFLMFTLFSPKASDAVVPATTANNVETKANEPEAPKYPYIAGLDIPVLMYHEVNDQGITDDANNIPVENFEKHLQYFRDNGYTTITMKQLDEYLNNKVGIPEKSVVLTFDDGLYSMKTLVLPLLKKYDMRALTFVIGEYADERKPGHLNPEEVQELKESGYVEVASHSYGLHKAGSDGQGLITTLDRDGIIEDMKHMQDMLGTEYFCYPFGHYNDEAESAIKEAGYHLAFTVEHGIVNESMDYFALPRMRVSSSMEIPPVD
ncbi:polysaccharide deacetylase family protein [Culicoidibacter larvae]|uniref:NodB homology domain-containing protein n=1 Tax=Culicoidibacter larvae TaxID=2579976 RepID=A0A5R8QC45_9FIRM|nr:polysaccharide deacetylase family protein [Culicoidibacter larvae]TLG73914.1 hypothetical protein FEZ08_07215 [Culicoidibacter larvae]